MDGWGRRARGQTGAVTDVDPADLLDLAERAARAAGRLVVERRDVEVTKTKTSATDIVTVMDQAAERLLVQTIQTERPDDGFLGEEGSDATGTSGVTWVLDPIDGTVNYLYAIPAYAVSVGVEVDGRVVAGVVCNPVTGELWSARRGHGAFLDGRRLRVNPAPELSMALIATGFGYDPGRRANQAGQLRTVISRVRDIRRMGAASLDLCALACGRVDGYYEKGLNPWDLAAGGLIAEEAGARVEGLGGRPAGADLVVAAPPGLFEPLEAMLADLQADRA